MSDRDYTRERENLEKRLETLNDFTGAYIAVRQLRDLIDARPQAAAAGTIRSLWSVIKNTGFSSQTQGFFLYREAAEGIASIIVRGVSQSLRDDALRALRHALGTAEEKAQRAAAGALGSLPVSVSGPRIRQEAPEALPRVTWEDVMEAGRVKAPCRWTLHGRSMAAAADASGRLLVIKPAQGENGFDSLKNEVAWMAHLRSGRYSFPVRFDVPLPVKVRGSSLFALEKMPAGLPGRMKNNGPAHAVCFVAHEDYFAYPNASPRQGSTACNSFLEVMCRNAWLLGRLASLGIIHSAAIPLFHNRIQRHRRGDRGFYEWPRGGRLDRWLASCAYPNFGPTGIRDFEHLVSLNGSGSRLYQDIGAHLMGLLLVAGSYFRNKDTQRVGLDPQGRPVDARELFEKDFFMDLVEGILKAYYDGFVGEPLVGEIPVHVDRLTSRMIEEMGVDRYMEEILRAADQREMSEEDFRRFLREHGFVEKGSAAVKKGEQDITVLTGPHLGGFNERISLPELIESVGAMSAFCIAGRYWRERFSAGLP